MIIGGLQKNTLIDYPGKIAATIFTSGCNFFCPWCYSSELVVPEKIKNHPQISEKVVLDFLKSRKGLIDGVVICGGEPTMQSDLVAFIAKIKKMGFLIKLDTNGSNPKMLKELIGKKLIDYVAMDIKCSEENYPKILKGIKIKDVKESIKILKEGKVDHEFRSTIVQTVHDKEEIKKMVKMIEGAQKYFLQNFRPEKTIDPSFEKIRPFTDEWLEEIRKEISPLFKKFGIR